MRINTKVISSHWTDRNRDRQCDYTFGSSLQVITATVSTIVAATFSVDDHIEYSPYKKRIPFFPLLLPPLPSLSLPSFPPLPVYLPSLISFSFQSPFPKTQVTHYRCGERCQLPQRAILGRAPADIGGGSSYSSSLPPFRGSTTLLKFRGTKRRRLSGRNVEGGKEWEGRSPSLAN